MAFCGEQATALTDTDMRAAYGTLESPGILPAEGFPSASRTDRGLLKEDALRSFVTSQMSSGRIPRTPTFSTEKSEKEGDIIRDYMLKDQAFITGIKQEYCFYDSRYRYALRQLIAKIQEGYTAANQANQQIIQSYLQATQGLNQKLNDLTQIVNAISRLRTENTRNQNANINLLNQQLETRSSALLEQNKILSSEQANALLYKKMVDYSKERAESTNNLLSIYSFMNIVVVGLLFYLYRSASE